MILRIAIIILCACVLPPGNARAAKPIGASPQTIVSDTIQPVMQRYDIPGFAVGTVLNGRTHVYNFGLASRETKKSVTNSTLFEIGSLTKTFTATLAAYAQVTGHLSLSDPASHYLPDLGGSSFDHVSLLDLATHTSGGLPLQVPDAVTDDAQLMTWLRSWTPSYPPGTYRLYSNVGIGILGLITARSMNEDFAAMMQGKLLSRLGMGATYLNVPTAEMVNYAQGYSRTGAPIRLAPGMLAAETYGLRTTAGDLLRFVAANMGLLDLDATLRRAIAATHTGYSRVGAMTQDLIWEQYRVPADLKDLLDGNSDKIALQASQVDPINPPSPPQADVLINKTGSTNGFAAYVAFIPARKSGIVLLANKNYPVEARVTAAETILVALTGQPTSN